MKCLIKKTALTQEEILTKIHNKEEWEHRSEKCSYFASEHAATRGEKPLNTLILTNSNVVMCSEAHHGSS
jgi:hypothetical protein